MNGMGWNGMEWNEWNEWSINEYTYVDIYHAAFSGQHNRTDLQVSPCAFSQGGPELGSELVANVFLPEPQPFTAG